MLDKHKCYKKCLQHSFWSHIESAEQLIPIDWSDSKISLKEKYSQTCI